MIRCRIGEAGSQDAGDLEPLVDFLDVKEDGQMGNVQSLTNVINSIMRSPCWGSTAMFLSWDDWGGFYDNVVPPDIDENGYGFRVPGLVISRPMAVRIPVRTYVKKPRGWGIWKATSISARPRARR